MPDDKPNVDGETKDTVTTDTEDTSLADLQGRIDPLDSRAKQMGFTNVEQYLTWVEEQAYEKMEEEKTPPKSGKESDSDEFDQMLDDAQKPDVQKNVEADKRLSEIGKASAHAVLEAQYSTFALNEMGKEDDEKCTYSKKDMGSVIQGPKSIMVQSLAPQFGGNFWEAAKYVMDIEGGLAGARKEGAKTAEAISRANETTQISEGNISVDSPKPTNDEDASKKLADEIAPKVGGYTESE